MTARDAPPATLPEMLQYLEQNGWNAKFSSRLIPDGTRRYSAIVWKEDRLGGGSKKRADSPAQALASALMSARRQRQRRAQRARTAKP